MSLIDFKIAIPILNEEVSLAFYLPKLSPFIKDSIIFVDNGSNDKSLSVLQEFSCCFISEEARGYGAACFRALDYAFKNKVKYLIYCDVEDLSQIEHVYNEFKRSHYDYYDFIFTERSSYKGAFHAFLGTRGIVFLSKMLVSRKLPNDIGPIRMVNVESLHNLNMEDRRFGWTLEMQIKAFQKGFLYTVIEMSHGERTFGKSKISGTLKGTILAAYHLAKVLCKNF